MLTDYVQAAMRKAKYKILSPGEGFFGQIPGIKGAWANASTLEDCRDEFRQVLEDWMFVRVRHRMTLPIISGIDLNHPKGRKRKVA
jgi:predicted RNase H-like HicB family nuclease